MGPALVVLPGAAPGKLVVGVPLAGPLLCSAPVAGGWPHGGLNLRGGGVSTVPTMVPTRFGPTPSVDRLASCSRHLEFQKGLSCGKKLFWIIE